MPFGRSSEGICFDLCRARRLLSPAHFRDGRHSGRADWPVTSACGQLRSKTMSKQVEAPAKPLEELSDEELDCVFGGIIIYDTVGTPVARYHLENAWPAK